MNFSELLNMAPLALNEWICENYIAPLPIPDNADEFVQFKGLLGALANTYAFLTSLLATAKVAVRIAKRDRQSKDYIDDCIDRRDIIDLHLKTITMQYNAFSRMITVQLSANEEYRHTKNT